MKPIRRNSFVFYDSFYFGIKDLSDIDRLAIYDAVIKYAIEGNNPPPLNSLQNAIFSLIKPQLDANNQKYKNGKRGKEFGKLGGEYGKLGGRPKTPQKPPKNPPNEKEKENEKDNNIKKKYTSENLTLDQVAERIIKAFNIYLNRRFKGVDSFKSNLEYWLNTYEPKEIAKAIEYSKYDKFWKDKLTPTILFRRKNPQGEPVDYISQLLLVKPEYD